MPLSHGKSKAAFAHNVKAEIAAGKPQKQAVAIAYSEQSKHMAEGGEVEDESLIDSVAQELLDGLEKKDKSMVLEALRALIMHIQAEDQEQDEEQS